MIISGAAVSESLSKQHQRNASLYLKELLASEPYSDLWKRYPTERKRDLPRISITRVISDHLWERGESIEGNGLRLKVSRALNKDNPRVTSEVLELFARAFKMSDTDVEILRNHLRGNGLQRIHVGELSPPEDRRSISMPYQTIGLREYHFIGRDGNPTMHRTIRDIRSTVPRLESVRYVFDTNEIEVERINGGELGNPYRFSNSMAAVDIVLPRPLGISDEHSLEFVSRFKNLRPLDPNFRRAAHGRIEDLSVRVEFHADRLPSRVWWAEWKDYRPPNDLVLARTPVTLDSEHAVFHRLHVAENTVVGFEWEFTPPPAERA